MSMLTSNKANESAWIASVTLIQAPLGLLNRSFCCSISLGTVWISHTMAEPVRSGKVTKLLGNKLSSSISSEQVRDSISGKQALQLLDDVTAADVSELLHFDKTTEHINGDQIVMRVMLTNI